jgi:hypothetical protein
MKGLDEMTVGKSAELDVMIMNLGEEFEIDKSLSVAEVFSMPRVTAAAEKLGLKSCGSYDILSGQDLMCPMTRKKVRERLQTLKPKLLVICPPCGPFSPLQNLNKHVNMKEWLKKRYQGRILLRYVMDLLEDQIKRGDIGLFEHPKNGKSWEDR